MVVSMARVVCYITCIYKYVQYVRTRTTLLSLSTLERRRVERERKRVSAYYAK